MVRAAAAVLVMMAAALPAWAQQVVREDLRIPMAAAGLPGLEALLVKPDDQRPHPLALISHGSPRDAEDRAGMSPQRYDAQALWFARRGFAALVVMRRGYGRSGGIYAEGSGSCLMPDYCAAARASVADLRAAIEAMGKRSDVTLQGMIAVGQSAGGFATVALSVDPPPGLVAAIGFAGGRGSTGPGVVCNEARLIEAFGSFGETSRLPMLWLYTDNDQYFHPALARQFHQAFTAAGGKAELLALPAFGRDGHDLFSRGIDAWTPPVDQFLRDHRLSNGELGAGAVLAVLPMPAQLSARGRSAFASFLEGGLHKAFAVSPGGSFGWRTGRRTADDARDDALKACAGNAPDCKIYAVDDALAGPR